MAAPTQHDTPNRTPRSIAADYQRLSAREQQTRDSTERARNALVLELCRAGIPNLGAALHAEHESATGGPQTIPGEPHATTELRVRRLLNELPKAGRMTLGMHPRDGVL